MHRTYRTQSATGVSTPPTRLDTGPLGPDDSEAVEDEGDDGQDHQHGCDVPGVAEPLEDMLVAGAEAVTDAGQRRAPANPWRAKPIGFLTLVENDLQRADP